jgi:hypothetical protein
MARIDAAAPYNAPVSSTPSPSDQAEIQAILMRLQHELSLTDPAAEGEEPPARPELPSRRELDRLWNVSAERGYASRPGTAGRVRGALLLPFKWVLRRLMRWYVEPMAADQRAFNVAVVRTLDELADWTRAELARIERGQVQPRDDAER